jgi:hypothetical protein
MHEFGHLVQDWTTFRGALNFLNFWDKVGVTAEYVRRSKKRVKLPIADFRSKRHRLPKALRYAVELEHLERTLEPRNNWFRNDTRAWQFDRYEITSPVRSLYNNQITTRHVRVLLVEPSSSEQYWHTLGSWEICEAYSVAVGTLHGAHPITGLHPYEYKVVQLIFDHYFNNATPRHIAAFCHWAVQDLSPPTTLFTLIEHFEIAGKALPSPEHVYDFGRQEAVSRDFAANFNDIVGRIEYVRTHHAASPGNAEVDRLFQWYRDSVAQWRDVHLNMERRFPLDTFLARTAVHFPMTSETTSSICLSIRSICRFSFGQTAMCM